ncbi:MAG: DnaB-like helicase N-terminal domain-containing protein, partial [Planctomycetota bacterium]
MPTELLQEKTQPFSLEAEISVLGSMIIDNDSIDLVAQILNKDSFYKTAHQNVFETIMDL